MTSRLAAEVPVGVFLSGGLDSGAIATLAARRQRLATFTLRPDDADFDEGDAARALATTLGTVHHEVRVDDAALAAGFEHVFAHVDEPIGDSSLVPTWLLSRAARAHVKVVLAGEGADELFGGYPTYLGARWAGAARVLPRLLRRGLARLAGGGSHRNVGTRWLLRRLLDGADLPPLERHLAWFGAFPAAEQVLLFRPEARPAIVGDGLLEPMRAAAAPALGTGDPVDALLRVDLLLHLPDALLAKVDRASMLEGLEVRAPFLERAARRGRGPSARRLEGPRASRRRSSSGRRSRGSSPRTCSPAASGASPSRSRGCSWGRWGPASRTGWHPPASRGTGSTPRYPRRLLSEHRSGRFDHARRLYPLLALLEWADRWTGPGRADTRAAPGAPAGPGPDRAAGPR